MFPLGVYIHIPFCIRKCPYCNFNSTVISPLPESEYIAALLSEMRLIAGERFSHHKVVDTVYFGGGTPSLLSPGSVEKVLDTLGTIFVFSDGVEITLEANPASLTTEKLQGFLKSGVNRLTIGFQSLHDRLLRVLGRVHSSQDALETFYLAREAGFHNLGIDLIFGIPTQETSELVDDLEKVLALTPEHIAVYNLTIEPDTTFFHQLHEGEIALPAEEKEVEVYETICGMLADAGYDHYEISNFALPGYHAKHNQRYWMREPSMGLGAGAHSYQDLNGSWGMRWWNSADPQLYMSRVVSGQTVIAGEELLTREEALHESLFLGLRQLRGINLSNFEMHFKISLPELYAEVISHLVEAGLVEVTHDTIRLTSRGILLSNEVFQSFF
jgi:oxygen-independent coproporphyrinogen-3 oxidase